MSTDLSSFVQDARRFILEFKSVMEVSPLQLYTSALVFSPELSIVKRLFSDQIPRWIESVPKVEKNWRSTLQTLGGHSDPVTVVMFSPIGQLLASASRDKTVKIWDSVTGDLRCTLGHDFSVRSIAFSPNGQLMASACGKMVKIWNPTTGHCRGTLEGRSEYFNTIVFSPDGQLLASESAGSNISLWDPITEELRGTLRGNFRKITTIIFSPNGQLLVSASHEKVNFVG